VARTDRLGSQATDAEENVAESGRMAELRDVGAHSSKVATTARMWTVLRLCERLGKTPIHSLAAFDETNWGETGGTPLSTFG